MEGWANQTGGWSPHSNGWHYATGEKKENMNWSNQYDWATNVRGYYNSADGSGWANSNGGFVQSSAPNSAWSNATGVPFQNSGWRDLPCQELLTLYNRAWLAYEAATASPTGTALNIDGSGDYSTAAQFMAFINDITTEWNRHQCGVLPPPPKGNGGGNTGGSGTVTGSGVGNSGGVRLGGGSTSTGGGTMNGNSSGGAVKMGGGSFGGGSATGIKMQRKAQKRTFFQRLFGN